MTTAFDAEQLDDTYPPGISNHFWNKSRNAIILSVLRKISNGRPLQNLLEIGCGRGVVLRYLRAQGADVLGVDLSPAPVDDDLRHVIRTACDCFSLPESERLRIRGILLLDVIEHIPDSIGFLGKLREAFPNCRYVLITVPARQELWSNYDAHYGHFRRYSIPQLTKEVRGAGFEPKHVGYLFHLLYPVMLFLSWVAGSRPTTQASPTQLLLHRLAATYFVIEHRLFPRRLVGTSIICAAEVREQTE